jgi:hypothetical protein
MRIRRPLAALLTALALFGGSATLTACGAPTTPQEGTTDGTGDSGNGEDADDTDEENTEEGGDLPNNSDPEQGTEDRNDDNQDPD